MNSRFSAQSLTARLLLGVLVLASFCVRAEARPRYKKVFDATYPDVAKANKVNCNVCHATVEDKKKRNHYGQALAKELKKSNIEDVKTIKEALQAIEGGDCRSGKWKERLDDGKVPCACGDGGRDSNSYIARQLAREYAKDR